MEYKVWLDNNGRAMSEQMLNELGTEGWELVQVVGQAWLFKRPFKKPATRQTRKA